MNKNNTTSEIDRIRAMFERGDVAGAEERCRELIHDCELRDDTASMMQFLCDLATILRRSARYAQSEEIALRVVALAEQAADSDALQKALNILGVICYHTNRYDDSYRYYNKALAIIEKTDDRVRYASVLTNLANVHASLGLIDEAIEDYIESVVIAQQHGDAGIELGAQVNLALSFMKVERYADALEHNIRALDLAQKTGNKPAQSAILHHFGVLYMKLEDYPAAEEYLVQAADLNAELNNTSWLLRNKASLANIEVRKGNFEKALEIEREVESVTLEIGEPHQLADVRSNIARTLVRLRRYAEAEQVLRGVEADAEASEYPLRVVLLSTLYGMLYGAADSELYNPRLAIEHLRAALDAMQTKDDENDPDVYKLLAEVYAREGNHGEAFNLLSKYTSIMEAKHKSEPRAAAATMKTETAARKREAEARLLANIAPAPVVERMIKGERIADYFPAVSIVFIDLVNFTQLAQIITPEQLLEFLNTVFSAFDDCAKRNGLEKIKTIGDAYMAVAGVPKYTTDHAHRAANFACDVLASMQALHSPVEGIDVTARIGIACGEAIAGIIGVSRLSYDLWGDAVNTASRMESHGEAGKIHCSEEFMRAVGAIHELPLRFVERGEMEVKGKGMMTTYFLEKDA